MPPILTKVIDYILKSDWNKWFSILKKKFSKIQISDQDEHIILKITDFSGEFYVEMEKFIQIPEKDKPYRVTYQIDTFSKTYKLNIAIDFNIDKKENGFVYIDSFHTTGVKPNRNNLRHYEIWIPYEFFFIKTELGLDPNTFLNIRVGSKTITQTKLQELNDFIQSRLNVWITKRSQLKIQEYEKKTGKKVKSGLNLKLDVKQFDDEIKQFEGELSDFENELNNIHLDNEDE